MENYIYYTGTDSTGKLTSVDLEEDLVKIIAKYNGKLCTTTEIIGTTTERTNRKVMKLYEISNEGAVNVQVSTCRDIHIVDNKVNGLVSLLGFNENSSDVFAKLHIDCRLLCNKFNSERK